MPRRPTTPDFCWPQRNRNPEFPSVSTTEGGYRPPPISYPLSCHSPTCSLCRSPAHRDSAAGPASPPPVSPGSLQCPHKRHGTLPALIRSLGPHFSTQPLSEETGALCTPCPWQHPRPRAGAGHWDGGWTSLLRRPCEAECSFEMDDVVAGHQGCAALCSSGAQKASGDQLRHQDLLVL